MVIAPKSVHAVRQLPKPPPPGCRYWIPHQSAFAGHPPRRRDGYGHQSCTSPEFAPACPAKPSPDRLSCIARLPWRLPLLLLRSANQPECRAARYRPSFLSHVRPSLFSESGILQAAECKPPPACHLESSPSSERSKRLAKGSDRHAIRRP